jgi:signal transduction histidine kinase
MPTGDAASGCSLALMTRVLIVDDHDVNLDLLRTVLQGHGFEVDQARDGAEALAQARRAVPDLVISDLLMPVMDGYTLLREWRADAALAPVPFIVYTATYSEPQDQKLALDLGADAYLIKTTEWDVLLARVREILAKARHSKATAPRPVSEAASQLKEYSQVLIHKLEEKSVQLSQSNRELEQANARLQQLSQRLLAVQEEERATIARELHDEIGQSLTAIKLAAQWLSRRVGAAEATKLSDCIALADGALAQVRSLALELRPPQLDQLGLTAALRDLTERMAASAAFAAQFIADTEEVAPGYAQATAAFRVVQEALTNIARHAAASRVTVELRRRDGELTVRVSDDGRSFDPDAARARSIKGGSMGLLGMQERVNLAGGWLRIDSAPGRGTHIEAGFPIDRTTAVTA